MLFAFGRSAGTYYAAHGTNTFWQGVPSELAKVLEEEPVLKSLAMGEGGAYFWRKMPTIDGSGSYLVSAATAVNYPEVKGIYDSDESINWIAFGDSGEYVVDTTTKVYSSDPAMVRKYDNGNRVPLRCASFGPPGVWIVIEDDGIVRSSGLPADVTITLNAKPVRKVDLSPVSASFFFCEYADGHTTWRLPPQWHAEVNQVDNMDVTLDQPADKSSTSVEQKMLFAFGPQSELFVIANKQGTSWRGCSQALRKFLTNKKSVDAVSMGEGGAFFWRSGKELIVSSAAKMAYPEVWKTWMTHKNINWVAFGPGGRYVVDTPTRIHAWRGADLVRTYSKSKTQVPLRCASFGYAGSWVVVEDDGCLRSHGLSSTVRTAMMQGNVRVSDGKPSYILNGTTGGQNIQLSQVHPDHYYVEFMDGSSDWALPPAWHESVTEAEGRRPKPTPKFKGLETLSDTSAEYNSVYYSFSTSWRHPERKLPKIHHVYKTVLRQDVFEKYRKYRSRVGNEQLLFHGTSRKCKLGDRPGDIDFCTDSSCALCSILRTSYRVDKAVASGMFGIGVYTSSTSSKAAGYSKNHSNSNYKTMILNRVAVGKPYFTDVADHGRRGPPDGFNSVCGLPGDALKHDETVIYHDDAIRPQYLIVYE